MKTHYNPKAKFENLSWDKQALCKTARSKHGELTTSNPELVDCEKCLLKMVKIKED